MSNEKTQFKKGMTPWNKGLIGYNEGHGRYHPLGWVSPLKGIKMSQEQRKKLSIAKLGKSGELANNWQGGKVKEIYGS